VSSSRLEPLSSSQHSSCSLGIGSGRTRNSLPTVSYQTLQAVKMKASFILPALAAVATATELETKLDARGTN